MLSIRLRRVGKTKRPAYRFVVADSRAPRDGAFVDLLGTYNPLVDPPDIKVDEEKTMEWIRKGAQPSETAGKLLRRVGMLGGPVAVPNPAPPKKKAPKAVPATTTAEENAPTAEGESVATGTATTVPEEVSPDADAPAEGES